MKTKNSTCGSTQTQSGQPCRIPTRSDERCRYHKTSTDRANLSGSDVIERLMAKLQSELDLLMETERESRSRIQKLGERLQESARDAYVTAQTEDFTLEEDQYGDPDVYGHLHVAPWGFGLATRSRMEDHYPYGLNWEGNPKYTVTQLRDWPVTWVRTVARSEGMKELTENLIGSIKKERENPFALQAIPHHMVLPSTPVTHVAESLKFPKVVRDWREAQSLLTHKPASAVRAAMVLVETVCKHILHAKRQSTEEHSAERLLGNTINCLGLGQSKSNQVLAGMKTIVNGMRNPRNNSSDAHGSSPTQETIDPLEAQLIVHLAGHVSVFLMEKLRISQAGNPVNSIQE